MIIIIQIVYRNDIHSVVGHMLKICCSLLPHKEVLDRRKRKSH